MSDVSAPSVLGRRWRTPAGGGEGAVRGAEGGSAHAPRRILFPSPPIRLGMRNLGSGGGVGACWEGRSRWSGKPPTPLRSGLHTQSRPHEGPSAETWVSSVDSHHRRHVGVAMEAHPEAQK